MALKKVLKKKKKVVTAAGDDDAVSSKASISDESAIPVKPAVKQYNVVTRESSSGVSAGERMRLQAEAVALIKQHIANPPDPKGSTEKKFPAGPFVPRSWAANYKAALGPYKKFVQEQCKGHFVIVDETSDNFTIKLVGDPTAISNETPWKRDLLKAWVQYAQKVPQGKRNADHFINVLEGHKAAASLFSGDFVRVPKGEYVQSLPVPPAAVVVEPVPAATAGSDKKAIAASPASSAPLPSPTGSDAAPSETVVTETKRQKKMRQKANSVKAGLKLDAKVGGAAISQKPNSVQAGLKPDAKVGGAPISAESRRQKKERLNAKVGVKVEAKVGAGVVVKKKPKFKRRKG